MGLRRAIRMLLLTIIGVAAAAAPVDAQKACRKGKPCGNTCIAVNTTCRVGTGTARSASPATGSAATPTAPAVPADAKYVASSRGRVYYWIGCNAWKRLSPSNLIYFKTGDEAEAAGYRPSRSTGCGRQEEPQAAEAATADSTLGAPPSVAAAAVASAGAAATVAEQGEVAQPRLRALAVCAIARVVDGDTVECTTGERVRLLLIDAPEMDQGPFGPLAKLSLEALLPPGSDARVELDVQERDRYGRVLAYLYLPDGRMVNEELVRQGYALVSVYPPNVKYVERIRAAAQAAQDGRYGLWATPAFQCLPEDHRAGKCE